MEIAVLKALKRDFLRYCSRDAVFLKNQCMTDLGVSLSANADLSQYALVHFRTKNSACYSQSWCTEHIQPDLIPIFSGRTAGYLAFIPDLLAPFAGVQALILWGQAGFETMFLAWAMRHKFEGILRQVKRHREQRHFVMVEWTVPKLHARPTSLRAFEEAHAEEHLLFHATRATDPHSLWKLRTVF